MAKRFKKPGINQGKKIKVTEDGMKNIDYPIFCFRHLHPDYSIEKVDDNERVCFINKLYTFSKMKWQDIQLAPRHGLGSEKISKDSIKAGIPTTISADVDHFLALRYNGKKPIVGYRVGNIFHIVYIDYNFSVYKH